MAETNKENLRNNAIILRDETRARKNTASRVYNLFRDLIDSAIFTNQIVHTGGTGTTVVMSQNAVTNLFNSTVLDSQIVQTIGTGTTKIISQAALTNLLISISGNTSGGGGGSGTLTGGTNGLSLDGSTKLKLGGTLLQDTVIDGNSTRTLTLDLAITGNTPIIRTTIGTTQDVSLLRFKQNPATQINSAMTDIFIGPLNGNLNANSGGNLAIGQGNITSLNVNPTEFNGARNIAIGHYNLTGMTTGNHNIAIGRRTGMGSTGNYSYSVDIGYEPSIRQIITNNDSHIAIGVMPMFSLTATTGTVGLIGIGPYTMYRAKSVDGQHTIAIGNNALNSAEFERYDIIIGDSAGRRSIMGRSNIMIGALAGADMTGGLPGATGVGNTQFNVGIGAHAMQFGSGNKNTFIGTEAGSSGVSGYGNSGIGNWALNRTSGQWNTGLGGMAGYHGSLTLTGSNNTFIGYNSSYTRAGVSNTIVIGHNLAVSGSNKVYLGSSGQTVILGKVNSGTTTTETLFRNPITKEIEYKNVNYIKAYGFACSDDYTPLTSGTTLVTTRMPYQLKLSSIKASLTTAQTSGSTLTIDVRRNGVSILTTKITIDNNEKTSKTAAIPPVLNTTFLDDDDEITATITQLGNGTATGLKIHLIGE